MEDNKTQAETWCPMCMLVHSGEMPQGPRKNCTFHEMANKMFIHTPYFPGAKDIPDTPEENTRQELLDEMIGRFEKRRMWAIDAVGSTNCAYSPERLRGHIEKYDEILSELKSQKFKAYYTKLKA